jgi:hypothetical protein
MCPVEASPKSAGHFSFGGLLEQLDIAPKWLGSVVRLPGDAGLDLDDWLQRAESDAGMRRAI